MEGRVETADRRLLWKSKEERKIARSKTLGREWRQINSSKNKSRNRIRRTYFLVQWLRICTSAIGGLVQSLVRELRSHMLCSAAAKKKKKRARNRVRKEDIFKNKRQWVNT